MKAAKLAIMKVLSGGSNSTSTTEVSYTVVRDLAVSEIADLDAALAKTKAVFAKIKTQEAFAAKQEVRQAKESAELKTRAEKSEAKTADAEATASSLKATDAALRNQLKATAESAADAAQDARSKGAQVAAAVALAEVAKAERSGSKGDVQALKAEAAHLAIREKSAENKETVAERAYDSAKDLLRQAKEATIAAKMKAEQLYKDTNDDDAARSSVILKTADARFKLYRAQKSVF